MSKPITGDEFAGLLRTFKRTAFRLETRDRYNEDYEQADLSLFLAGTPRRPDETDWFRPWMEQVARQVAEDKRISRVRVQADPPTDYQRWERWVGTWNIAAGEDIGYMTRSRAGEIGLPLGHDWWLLDDERVIQMFFTKAGEISEKILTADPGIVAQYLKWRDLAVRNATPAEEIAAA
jgi:hypothetical protein